MIITEHAVFTVTKEGLILEEMANGMTIEALQEITDAHFKVMPGNPLNYQMA